MNEERQNSYFSDRRYLFSSREQIVLYGLNSISKRVAKKLYYSNYEIKGIIDRKFNQGCVQIIDVEGYLVKPLSLTKLRDLSSPIVIICLNNGMLHREVARMLNSEYGIEKIIFLPMDNFTPYQDASLIRRAYSRILSGDFGDVGELPKYREYESEVIEVNNYEISFWCPIDAVYTFSVEMLEKIEQHLTDRKMFLVPYCNTRIKDYKPYIHLFEYLSGRGDANIQDYLILHRNNENDRQRLLNDRQRLFEVYEHMVKYDICFFTDSPTRVIYDVREKCFHVEDGLHRAIYLITKGYDKVPVRCTITDYKFFKEVNLHE